MSTVLHANLNTNANIALQHSVAESAVQVKKVDIVLDQNGQDAGVVTSISPKMEKLEKIGNNLPPNATMQGDSEQDSALDSTDKIGVLKAVNELNNYVQNIGRQLQFNVDDETGRLIVTVLDSETEEVIRQIPSEEVMAIVRNMHAQDNDKINLFSTMV